MIVGVVLSMSLLLQLIAVALSIRLVRLTGRRWAWTLITLAITLMAFRRSITLYSLITDNLNKPPDISAEAVALLISTLMVVGIALIARSHLNIGPVNSELKEEPLLRRMTQTALGLAAVAIVGSGAIVLLTYRASYQNTLTDVTHSLSNVTRHFTQIIETEISRHSKAEIFDSLDTFWEAYDIDYENSYLCVIGPDSRLLMNTRHPELVGRDVGAMSIQFNATNETTTFQTLILNNQTGSGTFISLDGEKQILTFAYAPNADILLAVHTPYDVVAKKTLATALPWSIGAGVMALILFPLAISMLLWSYKAAQRTSSRHQAVLHQTEARYQALTSVTSVGIFHTDPDGKCLYVNDRWCELTGLTPLQALGEGWSKAMHPDDRERIAEQWQQAITSRLPFNSKYRYQRPDGRVSWIFGQALPEFDASGDVMGYLGTTTDITEVKLAEQRFRQMLESAPDAMFVVNASGEIVLTNARVKTLFGYEREELLGQPIELLIPHRFHDRHVTHLSSYFNQPEVRAMGAKLDLFGLRKDGAEFPVDASLSPIETETGTMVIAAIRDITDKKELEEASQARIKRAERQQATMTELVIHPTLMGDDLKDAIQVITQLVSQAIGVERAGIWLLSKDRKSIRCENMYELTPNRHSDGMVQREDDYPSYFQALKTSRSIAASDAVADPRTCEFKDSYLDPQGITSMLDVAIRVSGEIVGLVCHEHVGELRKWTPDEIAFAGQVADQVALVLSNQERRKAKRALWESEEQVRLLLDSTAEAIFGLDLDGNCTFCNPACLKMLGYDSPDQLMGRNMHDLIHHSHNDGSPYPMAECRIFQAFREGQGTHVDDEVLWKRNGESFEAEYWSFPIRREDQIVGSVVTFLDITERKLIEHRQQLLMAELDHRVKNNLSAVIALAEQTLTGATSLAEFRESYIGRIRALARIHESLAATKWTGAKLNEILKLTLDPYSRESRHRINTRGEDIMLDSRTCPPITMAIHELATNAAKYGSLSTAEGKISIEWRVDEAHQLHLSWTESGGPPLADPPQPGFGTSLIRGVIEHELAGVVEINYSVGGLSCTITIPLEPPPLHTVLPEPIIIHNVKERILP